MSTPSEEDRFAVALHQAAGTLPAPDPDVLFTAAVRRGHSIRRRRRVGAGLGTGVALCAVATLAVTLPQLAPGGQAVTVGAAGSRSPQPTAAPSPGPTSPTGSMSTPPAPTTPPTAAPGTVGPSSVTYTYPPAPSPSPGSGLISTTGKIATEMLAEFKSQLPSSAVVLQRGGDGGPYATDPILDNVSGLWDSTVDVTLQSPGIGSFVLFDVYNGAWAHSCAQAASRTGIDGGCTTSSLAGGTLYSLVQPGSSGMNPGRYYVWLSADGYTTKLSISDQTLSDFQLSVSQIKGILTNPAWRSLAGQLAG